MADPSSTSKPQTPGDGRGAPDEQPSGRKSPLAYDAHDHVAWNPVWWPKRSMYGNISCLVGCLVLPAIYSGIPVLLELPLGLVLLAACLPAALAIISVVSVYISDNAVKFAPSAIAGTVLSLLSVALIVFSGEYEALMPTEQLCRRNLRVIARAINVYQAANYGQAPPVLQALVDTGIIRDVSVFSCPGARKARRAAKVDPHNVDASGDYGYACAPWPWGLQRLWDKSAAYHNGAKTAVYLDGRMLTILREPETPPEE